MCEASLGFAQPSTEGVYVSTDLKFGRTTLNSDETRVEVSLSGCSLHFSFQDLEPSSKEWNWNSDTPLTLNEAGSEADLSWQFDAKDKQNLAGTLELQELPYLQKTGDANRAVELVITCLPSQLTITDCPKSGEKHLIDQVLMQKAIAKDVASKLEELDEDIFIAAHCIELKA